MYQKIALLAKMEVHMLQKDVNEPNKKTFILKLKLSFKKNNSYL